MSEKEHIGLGRKIVDRFTTRGRIKRRLAELEPTVKLTKAAINSARDYSIERNRRDLLQRFGEDPLDYIHRFVTTTKTEEWEEFEKQMHYPSNEDVQLLEGMDMSKILEDMKPKIYEATRSMARSVRRKRAIDVLKNKLGRKR